MLFDILNGTEHQRDLAATTRPSFGRSTAGAAMHNGNSKYVEKPTADNLASLNETLVAFKANFTKQITKFRMALDLSIRKFAELQRQFSFC